MPTSPVQAPIFHIAVCGGGLAGYMTAAALCRHLPATYQITHIAAEATPPADILYGNVTAPSAYAFNLSCGVTEPALIRQSSTAFSLGTQYEMWGGEGRAWFQGFQLPLPILKGVPFHQYLTRQGEFDLEPYLASSLVARRGAFAHPPEQPAHPLSRVEYGYSLDATAYMGLFAAAVDAARVGVMRAGITEIEPGPEGIGALRLSDGQRVPADLFIDCTGPDALLLTLLGARHLVDRRSTDRQLGAVMNQSPSEQLGPAMRALTGRPFGWQSVTALQGATARLTVFAEDDEALALAAHGVAPDVAARAVPGRQAQAWIGNCVAIGQAAAVIEPLTPAPLMLLQADIERLVSLIPMSRDMAMECREFNRQFENDTDHADLFHRALFATTPMAGSSYWEAAHSQPNPKLDRKLTQFLSRGVLVSYDLEPFTPEDWTILHYGMGRRPRRSDRLTDQVPEHEVKRYLADMRAGIAAMAKSLPGHQAYMSGLKNFLAREGA